MQDQDEEGGTSDDASKLSQALALVTSALHLSLVDLRQDPHRLPGQLTGRLLDAADKHSEVRLFLDRVVRHDYGFDWWRCTTRSLDQADGICELVARLPLHMYLHRVSFSADGERVVVSGTKHRDNNPLVWHWHLDTGEMMQHEENAALSFSTSSTSSTFGTSSNTNTNPDRWKMLSFPVTSPNGKRALFRDATSQMLQLRNAEGAVVRELGNCHVYSVAWSTNEELVAVGCRVNKINVDILTVIRIWYADKGILMQTIPVTEGRITMAFSPDSKFLVSSSRRRFAWQGISTDEFGWNPKPIRVWRVGAAPVGANNGAAPHPHGIVPLRAIASVAISADGKHVVTADTSDILQVWDVASGLVLRSLATTPLIENVPEGERCSTRSWGGCCPAISNDGLNVAWITYDTMLSSSDSSTTSTTKNRTSLHLWAMETGALRHTITLNDCLHADLNPHVWFTHDDCHVMVRGFKSNPSIHVSCDSAVVFVHETASGNHVTTAGINFWLDTHDGCGTMSVHRNGSRGDCHPSGGDDVDAVGIGLCNLPAVRENLFGCDVACTWDGHRVHIMEKVEQGVPCSTFS